ncbi:MAG: alpha/beta family hydrolase [Alkalibacterium sp.]|uniref:alpha/beta family hydrolase n=1 Tax=Alkalibacterium sp. TaxID=1872447 RepID=UPI0039706E93
MKIKNISGKKWLLGLFIVFLLIIISGYVFLRMNTYEAMPAAKALIEEDNITQDEGWITITPEEIEGHIVFYQGGLVETEAYLPLANKLSNEGYQVFLPQMPFNLAILDSDAIDKIKAAYPSEKDWWLAGHSLGGASASIYAKENYDEIAGLIFLAAYPSDDSDLSGSSLPTLSITGTRDGILNQEQYKQTKELLPDNATYIAIDGGNHSNFGYYGFQAGDGESELSREEQLDKVVDEIQTFINNKTRKD